MMGDFQNGLISFEGYLVFFDGGFLISRIFIVFLEQFFSTESKSLLEWILTCL